MPESLLTRALRHALNLFPAYRGSGGRLRYISSDFREVRVEIPLSLRTRNYVGTIYGGSMFAATDPIFMMMLIRLLGPDFEVWDRAASIRFRKPGRTTLHAVFRVEPAEDEAIRREVAAHGKVDRTYRLELADSSGIVHAEVERVVHVRARARSA